MDLPPLFDAHLHVLAPARLHYAWLEAEPRLRRPFDLANLDADLAAERGSLALERIVIVEADCAPEQAGEEIAWVQSLARRDPRIAGMVAFAPLELGSAVGPLLADLAARPLVQGVRRLLQHEHDPAFCARAGFIDGVRCAAGHGLLFEACVRPHQLGSVVELARRVPEARIVLDHLGKPDIAGGELDPWRADLAALAALSCTRAKLSGLVTEAGPRGATPEQLWPYIDHALACFGPERLLFGSDWPVSTLVTGYTAWVETLVSLLERAGVDARGLGLILHDNARALYAVGDAVDLAGAPA